MSFWRSLLVEWRSMFIDEKEAEKDGCDQTRDWHPPYSTRRRVDEAGLDQADLLILFERPAAVEINGFARLERFQIGIFLGSGNKPDFVVDWNAIYHPSNSYPIRTRTAALPSFHRRHRQGSLGVAAVARFYPPILPGIHSSKNAEEEEDEGQHQKTEMPAFSRESDH